MALSKSLTLENGLEVSYHRVVSVGCVTNVQSAVEVASCPSREARAREKDGGGCYVWTTWHVLPYTPGMSVVDAYEYLKTLPEYEGAEDVLEEGGA